MSVRGVKVSETKWVRLHNVLFSLSNAQIKPLLYTASDVVSVPSVKFMQFMFVPKMLV